MNSDEQITILSREELEGWVELRPYFDSLVGMCKETVCNKYGVATSTSIYKTGVTLRWV
jgi:hypothetical protein